MLSIRLDPEVERRLDTLAKSTGRTKSFYARELIKGNLEDLEDRYLAESRLEKRRPPLTSRHVRKQLGVSRTSIVNAGRSVPRLSPVNPQAAKKRIPGIDKGKIWIADDF
jgi:RHH-type transcriptional regulator, rel operon repressor / antitoxin RelB